MYTYNVSNNLSRYFLGLLCTTFLPVHGTGLPNLLPASQRTQTHGSTATAVPQEGVVLFNKLRNINLYAMKHPKTLQGIVAKQDVLRVKKAFQNVFFQQKVLPTCMTQASRIDQKHIKVCNTVHRLQSLYDILDYIYGSANKFIHNKKRFSTYQEAYQAGIIPAYLALLDHAIRTAENIYNPHLVSPAFRKAFALLTGNMYVDLTCPHFTYDDVSHTIRGNHLRRLSPILRWLITQSHRPLPKEICHYILHYAYGKSFQSYERICSMSDVLFSKNSRQGNTFFQDKQVPWLYKNLVHNALRGTFFASSSCPVALASKYRNIVASKHHTAIYEWRYFHSLYVILSYIRSKPYLQLLQEGWTDDDCSAMEERFQVVMMNVFNHQNMSKQELEATGFFCLLGAFATSKALKCIRTTSCQ